VSATNRACTSADGIITQACSNIPASSSNTMLLRASRPGPVHRVGIDKHPHQAPVDLAAHRVAQLVWQLDNARLVGAHDVIAQARLIALTGREAARGGVSSGDTSTDNDNTAT